MSEDRPVGLDEITAAWQQAQEAFEQSERRYRDLVEHSLGLICTHDLSGRLLSINPAAARSLGYEPEHGIGENLAEFLAAETRHLFGAYLKRIRDHGHDAGLMRVVSRDGQPRVWMYRNVLDEEPDGTPYVLGHALDITERVAAERRLREKEQALRAAHADLDRRVQERTAELEQANDRLRLEMAERKRAEEHRERALIEQRDTLAFLAAMSEAVAPVMSLERLLELVGTLPVPFAADWTMVHVQTEDGRGRWQAGIHVDPGCRTMLERFAAAASTPPPADSLVARAIATGQVVISSTEALTLATDVAGPGEAEPLLQALGIRSVAIIPLVAEGELRSALLLGADSPDRFAGAGAIIVEDLARRISLALERIQLYRQAQEANRLKDEFLSTLSHELRTPLNVVYGWARILRMGSLDGQTAHAIDVIERNAEAQLRLIEDVLDVSRIIAGKMRLTVESLSIRDVLATAVETMRPAAEAKGVRVEASLDQDLGTFSGDPHRLQQVFSNLLSNAVKFTRAGDLITVALQRVGEWAEVRIADTGIGIRREVLPYVFDRFRQADSSTTRRHGGLGLGLSIARQIVELHGGIASADSAGEGHGATFTIRLPLTEAGHDPTFAPAAAEGPTHAIHPRPLHGRKVLVVEDHDDARELVARVLGEAGAEVISARSTAEALESLTVTRPDLLLADLGLPFEDGYTLLQRVRAMTWADHQTIPAVALTAYARASDRERAIAAGFLRYIVKPVDPAELVDVLSAVLESRG